MLVTNTSSQVQVFGSIRVNPGSSVELDDSWAPKLSKFKPGYITFTVPNKVAKVDPKGDLDLEPAGYPSDAHFATRKAYIAKADLHTLEVIVEFEQHDKLRSFAQDRIVELKG
jgi:hypothetical protein